MTWFRLAADVLTADQVADVWKALDEQVALRDPSARALNPVPMSVAALLSHVAIAVSAAVLGVFVVGRLVDAAGTGWTSAGVGAALLAPGALAVRVDALRAVAWGWLAGVGLPVLALTVLGVIIWLPA